MTLDLSAVAAIVSTFVAIAALVVTWRQLRLSAKKDLVEELQGRVEHLERQVAMLETENQSLARQNVELVTRLIGRPQP